MSARDEDALAGDPARLVRRQKDDDVSDVLRRADAAERNGWQQRLFECRRDPSGLHRPERKRVDGDAERTELACRGPRVALERELARAVRRFRGETIRSRRADVDDAS